MKGTAACALAGLLIAAALAKPGFVATMRGGGNADMKGTAVFGSVPVAEGDAAFHIDLYSGKLPRDADRIEFYRDRMKALVPGSYPLWDTAREETQPPDRFRVTVQAGDQSWMGRSGTLAITSVSINRIAGSFTARVSTEYGAGRRISATVTGTFEATPEQW